MVLTSNRPASLDWQNPATILGILGILTGILFVIIPPAYFWPASVIIGLLLLTATKPFAMLLLTIFFLCIESLNVTILYEGIYEVRIYPYIILGALTFFSCLIQKTRRREAFLSTPITLTMALIVAMESLSIFWSPVPLIALPLIFILICHLMLFVAIINLVDSEERIRIVINTWILTASFISVLVIISQWYEVRWEHLFNSIVSIKAGLHQQANRPAAVGGAINIGGYLALSLMLVMGQILLKKTRKERMPYYFMFILMLTALLETFSRGGIISLFGAFAAFTLIHKPLRKHFLKLMVLLFIVTIIAIFLSNPGFIDRFLVGMGYEGELYLTEGAGATGKSQSDLLESGDGLSGFDIRILWWKNAMGEMAKKPIKYLSGLGLGGFIYYSQFDNTVTSPEVNSYHLSFFYDIGIIGTFLYLILVTQLTAYLLKAFRTDTNNYMRIVLIAATTAMVADTVIYGLIDNDLTSHGARYFWIPIAFVVAIARLILNKKKDTTPIKEI